MIYGGSVKPDNIRELIAEPDVDGALVGGRQPRCRRLFRHRAGQRLAACGIITSSKRSDMILYYALTTIYVLVCLMLLLVILLQQGKGGDMASAFGGGSSQTAFGARGGATLLTKPTSDLRGAVHAARAGAGAHRPARTWIAGQRHTRSTARPGAGHDAGNNTGSRDNAGSGPWHNTGSSDNASSRGDATGRASGRSASG